MKGTQVKPAGPTWLEKLPPLRLSACLLVLSVVMLLAFLPVGAFAYSRHELAGAQAAAVACLICWFGSSLALVATSLFARAGQTAALYAFLFSMTFNFGLPFVAGLTLDKTVMTLSTAGVFGLVVVFFEISLLAHTLLQLCLLKTLR